MKKENRAMSFLNAIFIELRHLKIINKIEYVVKAMNPTERIIFFCASIVFIITGIIMVFEVNNSFVTEIPALGGEFREGMIGSPRFINPILAISDTDKSLSNIIYSGLIKYENGNFINDLSESYEISEDGKSYQFKLKDHIYFHDGKPIITDDIIFTIEKIIDPVIKSPKRINWEGVYIEKINDKEIKFTLSKPYSMFLSSLTIGIIPKHIWQNVSSEEFPFSEFNISPIGSGPYKIKNVNKGKAGIASEITLESFKKYKPTRPKIKNIVIKFFQNEEKLIESYFDESIDSLSNIDTDNIKKINKSDSIRYRSTLPRIFGVFFNQNNAQIFINKEIRQVLDMTTPRKEIIGSTLNNFGKPINGPSPENVITEEYNLDTKIEEAKQILIKNGWKLNEEQVFEKKTSSGIIRFEFTLNTSDNEDLKKTAEILKDKWAQIGAKVSIKVFESSDFSQNIIKTRKYDALLFGEIISKDSDLYPFWHSSERNSPGLNISLYTNIKVDKMLEDLQRNMDIESRKINRNILIEEIKKDIPAIFIFAPDMIYIQNKKVKNIKFDSVISPDERFASITKWYIETDKVWDILNK